MQEQMNRLLDLAWRGGSGDDIREGVWQPPVDIYEDAGSVVIKAEVPDIDLKDIEVKIEENMLLLRGERRQSDDLKHENYHRIERVYGSFQRSFALPPSIDQEGIRATCDRGVLTITLPKKEEVRRKQIAVEVK